MPENQVEGVSREEMESKLKTLISKAAENDQLVATDWNSLPLPQVLILNERKKALTNNHDRANVVKADVPGESTSGISRKRKSTDPQHELNGKPGHSLPEQTTNDAAEQTAGPADKRQKPDRELSPNSKFEASEVTEAARKNELRRQRFEGTLSGRETSSYPQREPSPSSGGNNGAIVGKFQGLEKNYFRLTSAPNPETVRPLPVLRKTLDLLKRKWKRDNNYGYICDQFKSLRQDLTVQHIRNEFTVSVYEIHARIALERGDLGEYNQCQTQLRALYALQLGGHPREFKAYRILYFIHTRNLTAMNDALADLTAADRHDPAVRHALDVRSALALGNYHRFFQLYLDTPNMGAYLMDMFVDRERLSALAKICKA